MELLLLPLFLVLGLLVWREARKDDRRLLQAWRAAAQAAGVTDLRPFRAMGFLSRMEGRTGPVQMRLESCAREREKGTRVTLFGLGHGPAALALRERRFGSAGARGREPVPLGDEPFDGAFSLHGSSELACLVFDAPVRQRIVQLVSEGLGDPTPPSGRPQRDRVLMDNGVLVVEVPHSSPGGLAAVLPRLLALAHGLVPPADPVGRLAANLRGDPVAGVRLRNLQVLRGHHAQEPQAREAFVAALGDRSEEVRLQAALELGERGRETLLEIASSDESDDQRAAAAIAGLGDHFPGERAQAVLARALRVRRLATAQACVTALGRRGGSAAIGALAQVLAVEKWSLAAAAAQALAATGEAAAEAPLIEALAGDAPLVPMAVAQALERVGTAAAVLPLREAAARVGDGEFRRAAEQAVSAIQSRLQGATPGQLSLAAGETGQVSLVEEARGRVSLTGPPWTR
jgi:HEAT repeat protein